MKKIITTILILVAIIAIGFGTAYGLYQDNVERAAAAKAEAELSKRKLTKYERHLNHNTFSTDVGNAGKIVIPDLHTDVNLYRVENEDEYDDSEALLNSRQKIVDDDNSALIYTVRNNNTNIMDHCGQTFLWLHTVQLGTTAFLFDENGMKTELQCVGTEMGYVDLDNRAFYDLDGTKIYDKIHDKYIISTCSDWDGYYRFVSYWIPVNADLKEKMDKIDWTSKQ